MQMKSIEIPLLYEPYILSKTLQSTGTSSTVTYTPVTELDYGTLLCTAVNQIGRQKVPCVFHIIAAGKYISSGFHI